MTTPLHRRPALYLTRRLVSLATGAQRSAVEERAAELLSRAEPGLLLRGAAILTKLSRGDDVHFDTRAPGEALVIAPHDEPEGDGPSLGEVLHAVALLGQLPVTVDAVLEQPGAYRVSWPPTSIVESLTALSPISLLRRISPAPREAPPPTVDPSLQLEIDHAQEERAQLEELVEKLRRTLAERNRELERSEAQYRALVEDLAIGIFLLTPEGLIDYASPRVGVLLDRDLEAIEGRIAATLFASSQLPDFEERLGQARRGQEVPAFDVTVPSMAAGLSSVPFQVTLAPLEGGPRVIGTINRTLRPELSRRLMEAQRLEAVGRMAGALAHQINNPAASVRLNLETARSRIAELESNQVDGSAESLSPLTAALDEALQSISRIASTLADLTAFSDERQRQFTNVDVDLVVAQSLRLLENRLRHVAEPMIDLRSRSRVFGNESLFAQVLVNLLSNASAAIEQSGRRRGTIWVRTRRVGDHVTIEISDDGCGMDPRELPHLRQPLVTGWKNNPSTGLGLATCDRVLATMKGSLDAVPRKGGGTTFLVNLPIVRGKAITKESPARPKTTLGFEGRPRVLMVDDELPILRAFTRLLSSSCDITTAESIDQLEEVLERGQRFDLVLCDLMMPKRSIVDAYDDLKLRFPWLEKRLVICTGGGFSDEAREFVGEKGLRLLDKPFSPEAFNKVLSEMPGRRTDSWLA